MPGILYRKSDGFILAATSDDTKETWPNVDPENAVAEVEGNSISAGPNKVYDNGVIRDATPQEMEQKEINDRINMETVRKRETRSVFEKSRTLRAITQVLAQELNIPLPTLIEKINEKIDNDNYQGDLMPPH